MPAEGAATLHVVVTHEVLVCRTSQELASELDVCPSIASERAQHYVSGVTCPHDRHADLASQLPSRYVCVCSCFCWWVGGAGASNRPHFAHRHTS